jgi:hypothetical protein
MLQATSKLNLLEYLAGNMIGPERQTCVLSLGRLTWNSSCHPPHVIFLIISSSYYIERRPDGAVIVYPEGGGPGVVGGDADGLGLVDKAEDKEEAGDDLVDEDVGHPDEVGLAGVEGEVAADGVHTVHVFWDWFYPEVLGAAGI